MLANWKILKSDQGPISTTLTPLLLNFENLDGNRRLPMPKLKMKWVDRKEEFDSTAPVGEFEGLIKDHKELMKKSCQKDNVSNTCTYSDENEIDNKLQQLSPTNKNSSRLVSFEEFKQSMRQQVLQTSNNNSLAQKYLDLMEDTANTTTSISSETDDPSSDDDDIKDFFDGRIEKYKKPQKLNIKWDIHRDAKTSYEKEAYLYDEEKGYERPYGKYYEFQKIDIPESLKRSNSIYRKGECYYDENGQLLYRVPFSGNHDA